jgi:hypothetical protein
MNDIKPNPYLRFLAVFAITLIATTPFVVFFFVMALVVTEQIIYPTATMATAAISGLVASWAASSLTTDEERTDLSAVVIRNLIAAIVPAVASIPLAESLDRSVFLIAGVLIYTSVSASLLATRLTSSEITTAENAKLTVNWLVGTVVGVGVTIFVASLFGQTGA